MTAERLSALDVAFLCLENSAPMHLGGVAVFDAGPGFRPGRVATLLAARAQKVARLRQRIRSTWMPPGGARWTAAGPFDVEYHIQRHQLRAGSSDDLAALSGDLMAEPLDLSRPPWQLHLVTGLAGGRFAVVAKFHHALCDASGAIGLCHNLLDQPEGQPASPLHAGATSTGSGRARTGPGPIAAAVRATTNAAAQTLTAATTAASQTLTAASIASKVIGNVRVAPGSPLLTRPTSARRVILARVDETGLQQARQQFGGTSHDVLLSVVSGALRHWLATRGDPVNRLRLRALIPTSQRSRSTMDAAGNQLSGYLCDLPANEPDPAQRLRRVRASMDRHKAAGARSGAGALPVLAGFIAPAVHRVAAPLAGRGAGLLFDIVVTTIPMPRIPLRLNGSPLRELYPLAPLAHGHGLAIALSRHDGTAHIGLHADAGALPDIDKLVDALDVATAELASAGGPAPRAPRRTKPVASGKRPRT
jgi:WS/DGAT/MGAT family acyltransferase